MPARETQRAKTQRTTAKGNDDAIPRRERQKQRYAEDPVFARARRGAPASRWASLCIIRPMAGACRRTSKRQSQFLVVRCLRRIDAAPGRLGNAVDTERQQADGRDAQQE